MTNCVKITRLFLFGLFLINTLYARDLKNHSENFSIINERLYWETKELLSKGKMDKIMKAFKNDPETTLGVLWDQLENANHNEINRYKNILRDLNYTNFTLEQKIQYLYLTLKYLNKASPEISRELNIAIEDNQLTEKEILLLFAYEKEFNKTKVELQKIQATNNTLNFKTLKDVFENKTKDEIQDIFFHHPDYRDYRNGKYVDGIKLFMFCRKNHEQVCLMLMKDKYNNVVKNSDGTMWNLPTLGMSRKGIPYYQRNGHTPSGVYQIDSVMPDTDRKLVYGKFRRLILNFPVKTQNEIEYKKLLPLSAHDKTWWQQSIVARDIGRSLLRIHGTGMKNYKSSSSHYPFVPTSGCIATREKKYDGIQYTDQRILLDTIMLNMGLEKKFENERKIKGLLYVIEIDDKEAPVRLEDLNDLLI